MNHALRRRLIVNCILPALAALWPAVATAEPLIDAAEHFKPSRESSGGDVIELDMGDKRVNWTNARWSVVEFAKARDLSKSAGIALTVTPAKVRADAGVYLAVREADGTWYYHPWAANLTAASSKGVARFEDFVIADYVEPPGGTHVDENGKLDLDKITAVAVGCINPFGIGKVTFTVHNLELLPQDPPTATAARVIGVTGKLLDVNNTTSIPAGVFGGFTLPKGSNARYRIGADRGINTQVSFGDDITHQFINTVGDRGQGPPAMGDLKFKETIAAQARAMAEAAKAANKVLYLEWWNEPYLNWSNKNRIAFNPDFFDVSKATEGGPVHLKNDGSVCPNLKWTQNYDAVPWNWAGARFSADGRDNWRRGKDDSGKMYSLLFEPTSWSRSKQNWQPSQHPPKDVKDGERYKIVIKEGKKGEEKTREVELTAFTPWYVYDQTQFTFWSAAGMGRFYNEPMVAAAQAAKAVAPNSVVIAGWGFRASEDHWAAFELDYKPTIDAGHEFIDGICDHDYGGDPLKMAANYEVLTAYGMSKYNKWLTGYNTETAPSADPQAYTVAGAAGSVADADNNKYLWTARKLMHSLAYVPDKARNFAWFGSNQSGDGHSNWFSHNGEGVALAALKNLRGRLVQVNVDDPSLFVVASIDGVDARDPRPADMPQRKELVVAVWNDHLTDTSVSLNVAAPAGTTFEGCSLRKPARGADGTPAIGETDEASAAGKSSHAFSAVIPARSLLVLTYPLKGEVGDKPQATRRQAFSPAILAEITPDKPLATTIKLGDELKSAKRARLRIVAERLGAGEGSVNINGKDYALPSAITPENTAYVREVVIDAASLKGDNAVAFKAAAGEAGYLLGSASIIVDSE